MQHDEGKRHIAQETSLQNDDESQKEAQIPNIVTISSKIVPNDDSQSGDSEDNESGAERTNAEISQLQTVARSSGICFRTRSKYYICSFL